MFEETQTSEPMDTNEDIDIFADDDTDFPVEPTSEPEGEVTETQQEGQEQQTEETQQQESPFLDIVYNGQQMHLTKEQAITLAQKGQNYDKKMQENESLRQQLANSPERLMLQRMAQQSGIPYEQFLTQFQNQMKQSAVQVRAEQLMQTGVMDQQTAMRLAQAELEKEELLNQRSVEQNQRNQQRQQFEQQQRARQQAKEQFTREIAELVKEKKNIGTDLIDILNAEAKIETRTAAEIEMQIKNKLKEMKIPILAEDTGLNFGRTVIFYPETGDFVIRAVGKPEKVI